MRSYKGLAISGGRVYDGGMKKQASAAKAKKRQMYPLVTASVRPDQWEWIEEERVRQRHGNRSRLVQDALDVYREMRSVITEEQEWMRRLSCRLEQEDQP